MPKSKTAPNPFLSSKFIVSIVVLGLAAMLVGAGYYWFKQVHQNPENVFWGMLENNLSTSSVTRSITQTPEQTGGSTIDQLTRLQFGAQNATQSQTMITQGEGETQSVVKSENIGTQDNDYSRYVFVQTQDTNAAGQPLDFSSIINVWGKTDDAEADQSAPVNYFRQAYLGSIVPFAQLPAEARHDIIQILQQSEVYEVDYANVRREEKNGQPVLVYTTKINPKNYVAALVKIMGYTGLSAEGLDPEAYANAQPIAAELSINPQSRQLVEIKYQGGQEEHYSSYGLIVPVDVPQDTIPFAELQQKIQAIQQ